MIVKGCPCIAEGHYADGRIEKNECLAECDKKCQEVKDCTLKKVVRRLLKVVEQDPCNNCDGDGYDMGCCDEGCGVYQAMESLETLKVECEEENE